MNKSWIYLVESAILLVVYIIARALGVKLGVVPFGVVACLVAFAVSLIKNRKGGGD